MLELSIIIVNWNSKDYLRRCLASVRLGARELEHEVLVIDSASFDGTERMLGEEFPHVRFIQSETNTGFARANNTAFKVSRGRSILFLNPDTEIVGLALKLMLERLRQLPDAGAVGCKLLNSDGTVQTSCIQSLPTILNQLLDCEFLRGCWPKSNLWGAAALSYAGRDPQVVEAISGACVMLKREVFEAVGQFSEDYFMYSEDIDLSNKVAKTGLKNYYVPEARVVHHGGGSSSAATNQFASVMMRESIWLFFRKTRGSCYASAYRASTLAVAMLRLLMLLMLWPVQGIRQRDKGWGASFRRWLAVFRWGFRKQKVLN